MNGELNWLLTLEVVCILPLLMGCYFLGFIRLWRGPHLLDRVVVLDIMALLTIGICAVYAITREQAIFVDIATVLALLSFLATIAFARYAEERVRQ
ncbi:MAG: cation:proton antiporter [Chloroflexota bacterium]|jgi:multicomponent Na+:H+ antiporter subunit F